MPCTVGSPVLASLLVALILLPGVVPTSDSVNSYQGDTFLHGLMQTASELNSVNVATLKATFHAVDCNVLQGPVSNGCVPYAQPLYAKGLIFVAMQNTQIYALNPGDTRHTS